MKKIFSIILILLVLVIPFTSSAAEYDTSIVLVQQNTNYVQFMNTTPTHYGTMVSSGVSMYPYSLISTGTTLGALSGNTIGTNVNLYITDPAISNGAYIYVGICNAFGEFKGSADVDTLFQWVDSIPGYSKRYNVGGSMGYLNPTHITVNAPSSFSITASQHSGSTDYSPGNTGTLSITALQNVAPKFYVPNTSGSGSLYYEPYWKGASGNNLRIVRIKSASYVDNYQASTVEVKYDTNDLCKATINSGAPSDTYLHSAIFVPICIVVPDNDFDSSVIESLDSIVNNLTSLVSDTSAISIDVSAIASYLHTGNVSVISELSNIVTLLTQINNGLTPVTTVSAGRWDSSIQYIEYYLNRIWLIDQNISANTDVMVAQLNNITSTLTSIANTIQNANDMADDISETSEDVHEQEQLIFEQANSDIGSTVISSFAFDPNTSAGLGRVGIDFTNLWNALGNWHNVYIFAMTLTLAFTIIRFSSARARQKNQNNKNANNGGS